MFILHELYNKRDNWEGVKLRWIGDQDIEMFIPMYTIKDMNLNINNEIGNV